MNPSSTKPDPSPISRTGRRMAFAGAVLSGGIALGSLFSPLGTVGAQESDDAAAASRIAGESFGDNQGPGRGDPEFLQGLLGVTAEELAQAKANGQMLAEFAADQGLATDELISALVEQATTRIAEAVEAGNLDAERAVTMTENLEERITERVNRTPGEGRGNHAGRHGREGLDASVLTDLGLDTDTLREAMRAGSTFGEAAMAQGVSEGDLVSALIDAADARLADAVESGRVDAEQAAEIEASTAERVQDRIDGVRPEGRGQGGRHGGGAGASSSLGG